MYRTAFFLLALTVLLFGDYKTGEKIFQNKCSSCHGGFIAAPILKKNFFEKDNSQLKLKAPTVNMLVWAIFQGPKKVGSPEDVEMYKIEIEEYLKECLYTPNRMYSICDPHILKYYDKKESMKGKISEEEIVELVDYFYDYREHRKKKKTLEPPKESADIDEVIAYAKKTGKLIIVEAMTPTCYFCKWMERTVFSDSEVQEAIHENFVLFKVNMKENKLPLNLMKYYRRMTPSFFFVTADGKLLSKYRGSWEKKDFLDMLQENLNKKP